MRFLLGLIIGVVCGGGGMYVYLERPFFAAPAQVEPDAGAAVASADDRGKRRGRRGRRGRKRGGGERDQGVEQSQVPVLTEAERALVWRGEDVALPPRQMDFGEGGGGRPLDGGEINQVIRGQSERMLACIAEARGLAPLEARLLVKMLVDGGGKVTRTRVRAPAYLFEQGFYPCASKAARSMRFPATGAATVVEAPYDLR